MSLVFNIGRGKRCRKWNRIQLEQPFQHYFSVAQQKCHSRFGIADQLRDTKALKENIPMMAKINIQLPEWKCQFPPHHNQFPVFLRFKIDTNFGHFCKSARSDWNMSFWRHELT